MEGYWRVITENILVHTWKGKKFNKFISDSRANTRDGASKMYNFTPSVDDAQS